VAQRDAFDFSLPKGGDLLVLGVTGGIASGKTTVANMLEDLGAPIIDFDLLSRQVVEPGQPAFKDIIAYFGDGVIDKNGTLDRKRLSTIVFRNPAKRKILEGITHPRILEAFVRQIKKMAEKDPHRIVQAVIPLLFEVNLTHLVHKVLVVYVSPDKQIERLTRRDKISHKEAENILKAQMPIDQKVPKADFVIHNEGNVDKTRKAVYALWRSLKEAQQERAG